MSMSTIESTTGQSAQPAAAAPPEYESKQELAARLGVSVRTISNMMNDGLPYIALTGKLRRFPRVLVNAWLQERVTRRH